MERMDDVSILFADIVGFTKMSSNKTAERLVGLLNDLFGRFDRMCEKNGCEKISTLGDCYYCVAGCPQPRQDHAVCCVEMGLAMIQAIKEFDRDKGETVNMRVGIHTGTVLCGIVGSKRFKFDVWSNDVTLANQMESSGMPGRVHVSDDTVRFLGDAYEMEEGKGDSRHATLFSKKTYFITGRKVKKDNGSGEQAVGDSHDSTGSAHDFSSHSTDGSPRFKKKDTNKIGHGRMTTSFRIGTDSPNHVDSETELDNKALSNLLKAENGELASRTPSVMDILAERPLDGPVLTNPTAAIRRPSAIEQADKQLIDCIRDEELNQEYFYKPPINNVTLFFLDENVEDEYRRQFQDSLNQEGQASDQTWSSPIYNTAFDVVLSCTFYVLMSISCFLVFDKSVRWLIFFPISFTFQVLLVCTVVWSAFCGRELRYGKGGRNFLAGWYPRHLLGALVVSLPAVAIFFNFSCAVYTVYEQSAFYMYMITVALLHYTNFVQQLVSWVKSLLAIATGVVIILLMHSKVGACDLVLAPGSGLSAAATAGNATTEAPADLSQIYDSMNNEYILNILLLLILVWFLNREFEIAYRLNFNGDVESSRDKRQIQMLTEQADILLHNIIPRHVAEQLKVSAQYSKNHREVGVIFASIVNFGEFYEENFEGGKECIRILNELIGDFDQLLERFTAVEKIKTIGSTYMAACGLHPSEDDRREGEPPDQHLCTLMEFCLAMMETVQQFNEQVFSMTMEAFRFKLRVGYNHGDVTAGVIGTTKLLYDIWGDTVNVASRMDSTGLADHIQVSDRSMGVLQPYYNFEYRGETTVKGKGQMKTYLVTGKKEQQSPTLSPPPPSQSQSDSLAATADS